MSDTDRAAADAAARNALAAADRANIARTVRAGWLGATIAAATVTVLYAAAGTGPALAACAAAVLGLALSAIRVAGADADAHHYRTILDRATDR